jgi:hypothetical protein
MGAAVDRLRKLSGSIAGFTLFAGAAALFTLWRDGGWVSHIGCCGWPRRSGRRSL